MALADYEPLTKEVPLPGGKSFAVRGISLEDITVLISKEGAAIRQFFDRYAQDGKMRADANPIEMIFDLAAKAPDLVAMIICRAADEPGLEAKVKKMTIDVQVAALRAIADVSFEASGGPEKFVDLVIEVLRGLGSVAASQSASMIGSRASGDR